MSKNQMTIFSIPLLGITLVIGYLNYHNYPIKKTESLLVMAVFFLLCMLLGYVIRIVKNENLQCLLHLLILTIAIDLNTLLTTKANWIEYFSGISDSIPSLLLFALIVFFILLFFLSIRAKLSQILFASYLAFFISTIILPAHSMPFGVKKIENQGLSNKTLPNIVHIIVDGHIGVEGIPTNIEGGAELKERIVDFYKEWGFELHGKAYSQHFLTQDSLSTLFNGESNIQRSNHVASGHLTGHRFKLTENRYFKNQIALGYNIRIIQSDYLDYCNSIGIPIDFCYNYPAVSPAGMANIELPFSLKAKRLIRTYLNHSLIVILLDSHWNKNKIGLTGKSEESSKRGAIKYFNVALMETIDVIRQQLENNPRGNFIFAHLLMPHYPYIWDSQCNIRLEKDIWLPSLVTSQTFSTNKVRTRESRYKQYISQANCLLDILNGLFEQLKYDDIFSEATIVIHGDHGSRLSIQKPTIDNIDNVSNLDLIDAFSTIFAIRQPQGLTRYSTEQLSLLELFSNYDLIDNNHNPDLSGAPIWLRTEDSSLIEDIVRLEYEKKPFD